MHDGMMVIKVETMNHPGRKVLEGAAKVTQANENV
jgi:hypothetical protein